MSRYVIDWEIQSIANGAKSPGEIADKLEQVVMKMRAMQADNVTLLGEVSKGTVALCTTDPEVAKKYNIMKEGLWNWMWAR
jgi:hypothetical protein